jgi:hypothetical protein
MEQITSDTKNPLWMTTRIDVHPAEKIQDTWHTHSPKDSHTATFRMTPQGHSKFYPSQVSSPPRDPVHDNLWLDHATTTRVLMREERGHVQLLWQSCYDGLLVPIY